jgi:hypothetical protein
MQLTFSGRAGKELHRGSEGLISVVCRERGLVVMQKNALGESKL